MLGISFINFIIISPLIAKHFTMSEGKASDTDGSAPDTIAALAHACSKMIKNIFMIASVSIMFGGIEIRSCIHASQINTSATYCLLNKTLLEFTTSIEFIACIDALLTQGTSVIDMRLMLPEKVFDAIKRIPHTPLLITLDQNKGTAILKDVGGILKIYYGIVDILLPGVVSFDCDTIVINIEGAKHAINKWLWETNNITDSELLNGAVLETMNIVLE